MASEWLRAAKGDDLLDNALLVSFGYSKIPSRNTINRELNRLKRRAAAKNEPRFKKNSQISKFRYGKRKFRTIKSKQENLIEHVPSFEHFI